MIDGTNNIAKYVFLIFIFVFLLTIVTEINLKITFLSSFDSCESIKAQPTL